jgi:hypothetical protein
MRLLRLCLPGSVRLSWPLAAALLAVAAASCGSGSGGSDSGPSTDAGADAADSRGSGTDAAGTPDAGTEPPEVLWKQGPAPLEWPDWAGSPDLTFLKDVSSWSHQLESTSDGIDIRHFADLAVGNGITFTFVGYIAPFNRFHSMVGPGYERGPSFFSDTWIEIRRLGAEPLQWKNEWIGRVLKAPFVWTQAVQSVAGLYTLDFAPLPETYALENGDPVPPESRCVLRSATVRNRSQGPQQFELLVRFARPQAPWQGGASEVQEAKRRTVVVLGDEATAASEAGLVVTLPELAPGSEHTVRLAYIVDTGDADFEATLKATAGAAFENLLQLTHSRWSTRLEQATTLATPDPMVDQYLEQQLLVALTQQTAGGAICPMSQYTHYWMRDSAGPVRFLLSVGLFEEVRRLLDFMWYGSVEGNGIKNAYDADLLPDLPVSDQPDWDQMGPGTDHLKAETPSHVPFMYHWYWKASGKLDFLPERLEMMKHAMWMQTFVGDLLPFSGDETYRAAMAVAHDQPLTEQFDPGFFSAFSSFLWVVGAETLAEMCTQVGADDDADELTARAADVRATAEATYLNADGAYLPYVAEQTLSPAKALFEDVSLQPTWVGYIPPDDPVAVSNLEVAITQLGGEDGILVSPLPPAYVNVFGLPISKGIYTGMNPGHYLWALAAAQHPLAELAFNRMRDHATPTGTTPEYQILDDFAPLHLMYSEIGIEPADYTARYRPWEGGINAEAVVFYLLGLQADARNLSLRLAPHLPNGWTWMEARGVRVGYNRFDLRIEHTAATPTKEVWRLEFDNYFGACCLDATLTVPLPDVETYGKAWVDSTETPLETSATPWGTRTGTVLHISLGPSATTVEIRP